MGGFGHGHSTGKVSSRGRPHPNPLKQYGGRKPEVAISQQPDMISVWFQRLRGSFQPWPITLERFPYMANTNPMVLATVSDGYLTMGTHANG